MHDRSDDVFSTRRQFLKTVAGAGAAWVIVRTLPGISKAAEASASQPADPGWSGGPGKARYRIEGLAKVTGQKIYARDFRVRDMKGWPEVERCALVLRTPSADRVFEGIDLSALPADAQPRKVVTAEDLARDGVRFPHESDWLLQTGAPTTANYGLLVAPGTVPSFMGQPVAILIFDDYRTFRRAYRALQFDPAALRFGASSSGASAPPPRAQGAAIRRRPLRHMRGNAADMLRIRGHGLGVAPYYVPPTYLTRYAHGDVEQFSQVLDGPSDPYCVQGTALGPPADTPSGTRCITVDERARQFRACIDEDLRAGGWQIFERTYETPVLDPSFLEPEGGLGWLDRCSATLHLVVGTQSPDDNISDTVSMFANDTPSRRSGARPGRVNTIVLNACYPGGGFGGRDVSTFTALLALAAAYSDGPVRLACDRFEQFQSGIKQLGVRMTQKLAVDGHGRFQALVCRYNMLAGGLSNYSMWVAQLAGYCAGGAYDIPKVAIDAVPEASIGVIAGSMRGFGGPQAFFAMESLVDEIAAALGQDPIELREHNALQKGNCTVTGGRVTQRLQLAEMCRLARATPLWRDREQARRDRAARGLLHGVGFALANHAYGTGTVGVMAAVEIDEEGAITVTTNAVDMGNGSATSLAISTAGALGANAQRIQMGDAAVFAALGFVDDLQSALQVWSNPRWTLCPWLSSSASVTAFYQVHVVEQASRVLLDTGLLPAARKLWKLGPKQLRAADLRWADGALVASGRSPLPLRDLAKQVFADGGVAGAMVHAVYQMRWVVASYDVDGIRLRAPIDGLSTRLARGETWRKHDRTQVDPPPPGAWRSGRHLYAPSATLAAVEIDPRTGSVRVAEIASWLEAGRVIQPDLVIGQYHGGVAMGVGLALLEYLPRTTGGAGDGTWNFHRYQLPLARDLPLDRIELHLMEPEPDEPARGIAEAVLCPVAPAIANAVASATGRRFRELPITPAKILEGLRA